MAGAEVWWYQRRKVCRAHRPRYCFVSLDPSPSLCLRAEPLTLLPRDYIDQHKVAIVCSARSGKTKTLGTTNLLLRAASEALQRPSKRSPLAEPVTPASPATFGELRDPSASPPSVPRSRNFSSSRSTSPGFPSTLGSLTQTDKPMPDFNATVDLIRQEHIAAARKSIRDPEILQRLETGVNRDCDWVRNFLFAAQVSGHCS